MKKLYKLLYDYWVIEQESLITIFYKIFAKKKCSKVKNICLSLSVSMYEIFGFRKKKNTDIDFYAYIHT